MNAHTVPLRSQSYDDLRDQRIEESRPADWPPAHHVHTPIVYRDMHLQLDGPEACSVVCLGEMVWAPTWPDLKCEIDQRLSTDRVCAGPDAVRSLIAPLVEGGRS